jgi:aminoglycoside N3'-acetyltransferase
MSKSYQDYKNVIYVHHSELSALIMKFDEIGLEHLTDRKECAVYFNEYDYKDKEMFINIIGEWEDNQDALK